MTLNPELIRTRCQEISDSVERLEKIANAPKEEFFKDQDTKDIASYRLLVAIEAALGICYHISAKRLKKVPERYAECFVLLEDAPGSFRQICRRISMAENDGWKLIILFYSIR